MGRLYCGEEESMEAGTIGIRADANAQIGMGHLMRCLSVAVALRKRQTNVIFITNNEQSELFLAERGFHCCRLQKTYVRMEEEIPEMLGLLRSLQIGLLLIDSYQASACI